ncbi:MAG: hypothetical protein JEY99_03115 [Spirochaetales bacterium]|nr:hypothetical protein [Spirochaetales bacterium]
MQQKLLILIILLTHFFPLAADENSRILINSGHNEPITSLIYSQNSDFLFSSSEDGTMRIWNPDNKALVYNEKISRNPIRLTALHPTKPEVAIVTSDNLNSFILIVYNWETGVQLYSVKLPEIPLFLQYSPTGSFIVYGITNWKSLTFIDSESGSTLPYLTEGFGIVSTAFISASEKTILTYSPSGYIQYWGVEDSVLKKRVPTIPNLENPVFTDNGRYMAASNSKEIMLIDLLSGNPVSSHDLEDIDFITFTPDFEHLYVYSRSSRGYILSIYNYTRNRLILSKKFTNLDIRKLSGLSAENGKIYMADSDVNIFLFNSATEELSPFSNLNLFQINDAAINDAGLLLTSSDNMLLVEPHVFSDFSSILSGTPLLNTYELPFQGVPGVDVLDNNEFILWTSEAPTGTLAVFSPDNGITEFYDNYPYSFTEINYQDGKVLTLDKNGECVILNLDTKEFDFKFTSFGLRTVCFTSEGNILGGRSQSSGVPTPLLHINTTTGETVDIEDNNRLTSHLSFDPVTGNIYSIGIEERRNRLRTVLRKHTGGDFNSSETILTALGENLDASMLIEEGGTRIFTALTSGGINMLYWGGFTPFEDTGDSPKKMLILDSFLIGLNTDGSLTFWNKASGEELFTFYLFTDLSWAAIFPDQTFLASPEGEKYLNIYDGVSRRKLSTFRFRKNIK